MKKILAKTTALILVLVFIFAFSACKNNSAEETTSAETATQAVTTAGNSETAAATSSAVTTLPEETATAGETTAAATVTAGQTTSAAAATSAETETKTPAATGINAPVGTDIADIVAFYNRHANATKEYPGKINVQRDMGTITTITKMGWGLKGILQSVLDRQLKDKSENKTFVNGKNPTDSNDTLEKFLPRGGGEKMSILTAPGVKRASCVQDGTGWKVVIVLKKEVSTIDKAPKYHSSVMDPLEIDSNSLDPFTLGDGKVIYGQINAPYDGATLVAKFNKNGYLDHLRMDAPLQISGKLGYKNKGNIETVIDGSFWGDMTFKYL